MEEREGREKANYRHGEGGRREGKILEGVAGAEELMLCLSSKGLVAMLRFGLQRGAVS